MGAEGDVKFDTVFLALTVFASVEKIIVVEEFVAGCVLFYCDECELTMNKTDIHTLTRTLRATVCCYFVCLHTSA